MIVVLSNTARHVDLHRKTCASPKSANLEQPALALLINQFGQLTSTPTYKAITTNA